MSVLVTTISSWQKNPQPAFTQKNRDFTRKIRGKQGIDPRKLGIYPLVIEHSYGDHDLMGHRLKWAIFRHGDSHSATDSVMKFIRQQIFDQVGIEQQFLGEEKTQSQEVS